MSNVFIANEHRKARKVHKCCECRISIHPGEMYWHYRGISDGEPTTAKTCESCEALRNDVMATWDLSDLADGFAFGELGDYCYIGSGGELWERWKAIWAKAEELRR